MNRRLWTEEDSEYCRKMWPEKTVTQLADALGFAKRTVRFRVASMGLRVWPEEVLSTPGKSGSGKAGKLSSPWRLGPACRTENAIAGWGRIKATPKDELIKRRTPVRKGNKG